MDMKTADMEYDPPNEHLPTNNTPRDPAPSGNRAGQSQSQQLKSGHKHDLEASTGKCRRSSSRKKRRGANASASLVPTSRTGQACTLMSPPFSPSPACCAGPSACSAAGLSWASLPWVWGWGGAGVDVTLDVSIACAAIGDTTIGFPRCSMWTARRAP